MSGKLSSIIVLILGLSFLIAACGSEATAVPAPSAVLRTQTPIPTLAPTASPVPSATAAPTFEEMSAGWRDR